MSAQHNTPEGSTTENATPGEHQVMPEENLSDDPQLNVEPHEPPIIIGGGNSLYIDLPLEKDIDAPQPIPTNVRPYNHRLKSGAGIRALGSVKVFTEPRFENGVPKFKEYGIDLLGEDRNCELRIYLAQLREGSLEDYVPIEPAEEPQLILAGNPFRLEVDKELQGPAFSFRLNRPQRYNHPGYKRRFRIRQWKIFTHDGIELVGERDDESYTFACSFHHVH